MTAGEPKEWSKWLPLAQWWYNSNPHSTTGISPYEILFSQPAPIHLPYLPGETKNTVVDRSMQRREAMIQVLRLYLLRAQHRIKLRADRHRSDREFGLGTWVWLKLQLSRKSTVEWRANEKLSPRYYRPFQVKGKIGKVAYKLSLPSEVQIHDVCHVSQLKAFQGNLPAKPHIPTGLHGLPASHTLQPAAFLDRKLVKRNNRVVVHYLIL